MCGVKPARRPELAAEVKYLTWTGDNLLRQVVYERLREDKPAAEVRREVPIGKPDRAVGHSVVTRDGGLCP
jgi:ATP-dependent DNA ligase